MRDTIARAICNFALNYIATEAYRHRLINHMRGLKK